jgi:hypothetical protein
MDWLDAEQSARNTEPGPAAKADTHADAPAGGDAER